MRIAAALCHYDEPPEFLSRCISSLEGVADVLVTADGAWEHFPDGEPWSPDEQTHALAEAVRNAGIQHHVIEPDGIWRSQVAKRSELYGVAASLADWLFVIDGDEWVKSCSSDFRTRLAATDRDVAIVHMNPRDVEETRFLQRRRRLFRSVPGLHVQEAHNGVVTGDGRWLGGPRRIKPEPAADLTRELLLGHSFRGRSDERNARSRRYYGTRQRLRVEVH